MVFATALHYIFIMISSAPTLYGTVQPGGSQVPPATSGVHRRTDPRVGQNSTSCLGTALCAVKPSGRDQPLQNSRVSQVRKRAYRRAGRRAEARGSTWYRGQLVTAQDLQSRYTPAIAPDPLTRAHGGRQTRQSLPCHRGSRLKVATYNCGGMTAEQYDIVCEWLSHQTDLDIVAFQETHWGLGRVDATWQIPGWSFITSADPQNRYCGVAVAVSRRVASHLQITYCTWLPGRLLHVKCEGSTVTMDLLCAYQWVRQDRSAELVEERRQKFWLTLEKVLQHLPQRNLLVVMGDFNTPTAPVPGLVGRGVLCSATRGIDEHFQQLLRTHQLVLLNTWSSAAAGRSATFVNHTVQSQIDYIAVRRVAADATARTARRTDINLSPWRLGPRHRLVQGSIPWVAGWRLKQLRSGQPKHQYAFSKPALQECIRAGGDQLQDLRELASTIFTATTAEEGIDVLNSRLIGVCRRLFPVSGARTHCAERQFRMRSPVRCMWQAYHLFRRCQRHSRTNSLFSVWRAYATFRRHWQQLRRASRAERRRWLAGQIEKAHQASLRQDMCEVYRVVRLLAPKQRREAAQIRSPTGHLLGQKEQFEAIHTYFSQAFSRSADFSHARAQTVITFTAREVEDAIHELKPRKAVPPGSPLAEVWQLCPQAASTFLLRALEPCLG